jgi:hypothetical protein
VNELTEDAGRDIEEFAHALVHLKIADETQLAGCSEEEMAAVLERAGGFPLSAHYVAFLKRLGRQAGRLLRGTDFYYPEPLEANDYAVEFAAGDDPGLRVEGRFFFATHQGYQLYFFEESSPEKVFMYTEKGPEPQLLEDSLVRTVSRSLCLRET